MPFSYWIFFDAVIILFQLGFLLRFYIKKQPLIGSLSSIGLVIGALIYIFPLGLFPVGLAFPELKPEVFRDFLWHIKIILTLSVFDLLLLFYFLFLIFFSYHIFLRKNFLTFLFIFLLIIVLGLVSTLNAPFEVDYSLVLNSFRTFLIIMIAFILSNRLNSKVALWLPSYLFLLVSLSYLSIMSMFLLETDVRAVRYWTHSILQSQSTTLLATISLILLLFTKYFNNLSFFKKIIIFILPILVSILGGVKGMILILFIVMLSLMFYKIRYLNYFLVIAMRNKSIILIYIFLLPFTILLFNYTFLGISAVNTRFFQVFNSMSTLMNNGISSLLFGIGWKQWYFEYLSSPIIDHGAWTPEEIATDGRKYAIQLLPFSYIRSVGLVGLLLFFWLFFKVSTRYKFSTKQETVASFLLLFVLFSEIAAVPDILPESAFLSVLVLFSLMQYKQNMKAHERCQ